mgnify:CR=1 FL=1
MPKGFGGGGGVGAGMPRPMPNPRFNPAPAPAAGGMGGGLFPNMGAQQRYDMAMGLLKNGMQMGAESGSLLAAFLSPLAGAALGGSITNKYEKAKAAERAIALGGIYDGSEVPKELNAMTKAAAAAHGDWLTFFTAIMRTGLDGVFADHPDLALEARAAL